MSGDTAVRLYIIFGVPHAWSVRVELIPVLLHLVKLIYLFTRDELSNFKGFNSRQKSNRVKARIRS